MYIEELKDFYDFTFLRITKNSIPFFLDSEDIIVKKGPFLKKNHEHSFKMHPFSWNWERSCVHIGL